MAENSFGNCVIVGNVNLQLSPTHGLRDLVFSECLSQNMSGVMANGRQINKLDMMSVTGRCKSFSSLEVKKSSDRMELPWLDTKT